MCIMHEHDVGWDDVVGPPASPESDNGWADVIASPVSTVIAGGGWSDIPSASEGSASSIGDFNEDSLFGDRVADPRHHVDVARSQDDPSSDHVASVADDSVRPEGGRWVSPHSHYKEVWEKVKGSLKVPVNETQDVDVGIDRYVRRRWR